MGKYIPQRRVSSTELEEQLGLEKGWIYKSNGIQFRHHVNEKESGAYMGAQALQEALDKANMQFKDLDLLIDASGSFDFPIPHNACLIPRELGILDAGIPCWDVDSTCLGFVTALDMVSYLLDGERDTNVAIVNSEIASKSLNPADPKTATLFGDAATAAIITIPSTEDTQGILAADMETYAQGAHYTRVKGGGNSIHPNEDTIPTDFNFAMQGKLVMRLGMQRIVPFVEKLFSNIDITMDEVDCIIPHQASKMALNFAQKTFDWKDLQLFSNLANYGNCISASIPLALLEAIDEGKLKRGDSCLLLGTAAGLSVGGVVLIY